MSTFGWSVAWPGANRLPVASTACSLWNAPVLRRPSPYGLPYGPASVSGCPGPGGGVDARAGRGRRRETTWRRVDRPVVACGDKTHPRFGCMPPRSCRPAQNVAEPSRLSLLTAWVRPADRPVVAWAWRMDLVKGTSEGAEGTEAAMDHPIARVSNLGRWPYAIALKGKSDSPFWRPNPQIRRIL